MKFFTEEWFRGGCYNLPGIEQYYESLKSIRGQVGLLAEEPFLFHDAKIKNVVEKGNNKWNNELILKFDSSQCLANISMLVLKNYDILLFSEIKGCWWLAHEIYKHNQLFILNILFIDNKDNIKYFEIEFEKVIEIEH